MAQLNVKVALYLPSLEGGGAERVIVNLANVFSSLGLSVDLVLVRKDGPNLLGVSNNVNMIDLRAKRVLYSIYPLIKYIKFNKPDVILSTLNYANVIAILANKVARAGSSSIIRIAGYFSLEEPLYIKLLARVLYRKSDLIIAISNDIKKDLINTLHIPGNKIKVIYNPMLNACIKEKASENVDHRFFKDKNNKVIIGVGSLCRRKNFIALLMAFLRLSKKEKRARLIILGEGEEREHLEFFIDKFKLKEVVSLPGFVNNPYAYMAKSDVFVLSSLSEGFGNVLIEAMACGTSVVSVDCPGGPSEILEQGKYGMLVQSGDTVELSNAIEEILEAPFNSELLKNRAMDFDVEVKAREYMEAILGKINYS